MFEERKIKRLKFKKNDTIIKEGTTSDAAYMVVKGKVAVIKGSLGEHPKTVATLGRGNIIGEMALFDGQPHIATVTALEDTEVSALSRHQFNRLVDSMDPIMKGIVGMLVSRLRQTVDELVPKGSDVNWVDWRS